MKGERTTETKDIYQRVTDQIIEAIEAGAEAFKLPWRTSGGFPYSPINAVSKRPYRGVNIVILWAMAQKKGYTSGTWATFKQWQELGAQVRKGEKSAHVVFWKFFDRENSTEDGDGTTSSRKIPMAKDYWIFNADQVDGYRKAEAPPLSKAERIEYADNFFSALGVDPKPEGVHGIV